MMRCPNCGSLSGFVLPRLTTKEADLLFEVLARLSDSIWEVYGDELARIAQHHCPWDALSDEIDQTHTTLGLSDDDIPF
jgi:hypothetical protein